MRTAEEIAVEMDRLRRRNLQLQAYMLEVTAVRKDWHGVQDAASDLRETEAAMAALSWVCGDIDEIQ